MIKKLSLVALFLLGSSCAFADSSTPLKQQFFYGGLLGGFGYVDWSSVIAADSSAWATNPTSVSANKGGLFGADVGYQLSAHFAVEAEYIRLPTSELTFFPIFNDYLIFSGTESTMDFGAVTLKVIAPVGSTPLSVFADAGPAYQYQTNDIKDIGTWAPTFGGGFLYRMDQHWQMEASFQYAPGTGKSIIDPMIAFIPEIYMGTVKIDYIF